MGKYVNAVTGAKASAAAALDASAAAAKRRRSTEPAAASRPVEEEPELDDAWADQRAVAAAAPPAPSLLPPLLPPAPLLDKEGFSLAPGCAARVAPHAILAGRYKWLASRRGVIVECVPAEKPNFARVLFEASSDGPGGVHAVVVGDLAGFPSSAAPRAPRGGKTRRRKM